MDAPIISVITVCYNVASTIEKTMLSVLNQTYKNLEYIIIDGNSTDGTVDIIKKYAERLTFWISEPDKGIYDAMNKGIVKATGKFLIFMNAGGEFPVEPGRFYCTDDSGFHSLYRDPAATTLSI